MEVIVVGAGVFGASLADALAARGDAVRLVEPYEPGHVRAGSGGESRLLRFGHGDDAFHARLAHRAADLWDDLDPDLLVRCGLAWFAHRPDGWEAESERTLRSLGIAVERVDAAALFPSVNTDDLDFTLLEPGAGVLRARRATRALVRRAVGRGARLEVARARPDGVAVRLDDGRRLHADRVVWACGAWLAGLFAEAAPLRVTQQDVTFFAAGPAWRTPPVPGWVDYDRACYGLGDLDGEGMKANSDVEGPPLDPDGERRPLSRHVDRARSELAHRFPALAGAALVQAKVCQYELTPDTRFVAAPHPAHEGRVWLLGGGSGHGFKHGPALAELVADQLHGLTAPEPRFAIGARAVERALRTAGR